MRKKNTKKTKIHLFIIPFVLLFLLFAMISHLSLKKHINDTYVNIQENSLAIADSYVRRLVSSSEATDTINKQIDEKLLIVCNAILELGDQISDADVSALAKQYYVDEINVYNPKGVIINSNNKNAIGNALRKDHILYHFISNKATTFLEDIRPSTLTGISHKYAYTKIRDSHYVQIGILADEITNFLEKFVLKTLINEIMSDTDIENIFFTDTNFNLVLAGTDEYAGIKFNEETVHEHFLLNEARVGKEFIDGSSKLHVCAPVFYNDSKIGTLSVVWPSKIFDKQINEILYDNLLRLLLVAVLMGSVMYYAYLKNKSYKEIAFYDSLTQLPNANYFTDYINSKTKECLRNEISVLLLQCFNFQLINMTYGFEYGNNILKQVTSILQENLADKHMLFRLEGNLFAIVANDYEDKNELISLVNSLAKECYNPDYDIHKHKYLNFKFSIYEIKDENLAASQIVQYAAMGLATIRYNPNKNYTVYDKNMKDSLTRAETIEKALSSVINGEDNDVIHIKYQPLFDLKTNEICGFEALARMNIDNLGPIPSMEFIDLAEKRNMIYSLGNIIINETYEFLEALRSTGFDDLFLSVNISRLQLLRDEFLDTIKHQLNVPPEIWKQYIFEVTESAFVEDFDLLNGKLKELRKLGISIALDDFGTGFSSFTDLRNMDLNFLKIDSAFVNKVGKFDDSTLITQDIITMAHKLNLKVIAEGVENKAQIDYLRSHGCDIVQGYFISDALSGADAIKLL